MSMLEKMRERDRLRGTDKLKGARGGCYISRELMEKWQEQDRLKELEINTVIQQHILAAGQIYRPQEDAHKYQNEYFAQQFAIDDNKRGVVYEVHKAFPTLSKIEIFDKIIQDDLSMVLSEKAATALKFYKNAQGPLWTRFLTNVYKHLNNSKFLSERKYKEWISIP